MAAMTRRAWSGTLRKSGSAKDTWRAPASTSWSISATTAATSTGRTRPSYTTGTGQCRHRWEQPRLASTDPTRRSSPPTASLVYRSRGGNRCRAGNLRLDSGQLNRRAWVLAVHPRHQTRLVLAGDHGIDGRPDSQIPGSPVHRGRRSTAEVRVAGPGSFRRPAMPGAWRCASARRTPPGRPSRHRLRRARRGRHRRSEPRGQPRAARWWPWPRAVAGGPVRRWTAATLAPPRRYRAGFGAQASLSAGARRDMPLPVGGPLRQRAVSVHGRR